MMTPEQAARLRVRLDRLGSTASHERADARYCLTHPDMAESNARLLLRYHDALAPKRLAAALSEALDEQAERGGGLNVNDLAVALRAKLMEGEHG